jgi:hypothetical protein
MNDELALLWACLDTPAPLFSQATITSWPAVVRDWLVSSQILRETTAASQIACPACEDGHVEEVIQVSDASPARYYIPCPENLRVEIDPEDLRRWTVDFDALAANTARALCLAGEPMLTIPGRLWQLGRTSMLGTTRGVVFVRRLDEPDAAHVVAELDRSGRDIVLVPRHVPDERIWPGRVPAVIPLSQVATLEDESVLLDVVALTEMIAEADRAAHTIGGLTVTDAELNSIVKRKVKAAQKSALTDDAIVAAYKIHGTARATEEALKAEGYEIDHSTIARKVKQAEEAEELRETLDSGSIGRSVASQPCDRGKKIDQYRK